VLGYPRVYELSGTCWAGLSEAERAAVNAGADALVEVIAQRAARAGFVFADLRGPFTGHGVCSDAPWLHSVNWLNPVESYHPTATGHAQGYLPALRAVTGRPTESLAAGH